MKQKCLLQSIFLVVLSITGLNLKAQTYHPMPVSGAQWNITRCWYFYPGGWHDEYAVKLDGTDTTINGHVYKKLIFVTHHAPGTQYDSTYSHILGGMRESNKQVFFISEYLCLDTIERMLYDFNEFETDDTIFTQVLTNGLTQFIPHIVTSVDSVLVGNENHRRINVRDENDYFHESWIEGVGSTLGLIYPSYWLLTDNSYDLNCFYNENELQFTNPFPAYLFCSAPLPDIQCEDLPTSIPPVNDDYSFKIYPNPAIDVLNVESEQAFNTLSIFNSLGERLLTFGYSEQIEINSLAPGIYFIQLKDYNKRIMATLKFVKN